MLCDPTNTLAFHQSRLFTRHRDMSTTPCSAVALAFKQFKDGDTKPDTKPETEALYFYGLNHAVSLIAARRAPLEPLPSDELNFVEKYYELCSQKAVRAFYYLLIVCIREARHSHSTGTDAEKIAAQFSQEVSEFFCKSGGEGDIHQRFLNKPPKAWIGQLTGALVWQFYHSSWSSGFGGKKWGSIADCLHRFVTGEYTAEMMMDTIWTLQHNGGVLFNKGHVYGHETHTLKRILDIQRSGQIPHAILFDKPVMNFAPTDLQNLMQFLRKKYPEEIGMYVDWFVVEALGSVHKYPNEKTYQTTQFGLSAKASEAQKKAAKIAADKLAAEQKIKDEEAKKWFHVMYGVKVQKIYRNPALAA